VFLDRKEVILEIPTNKRKSFVAEKPPRQGPSLERLLGVWKAAEREARRKKDAEVEAAQKVYYMHTHRLQVLKTKLFESLPVLTLLNFHIRLEKLTSFGSVFLPLSA
jgi:hypothetical protein